METKEIQKLLDFIAHSPLDEVSIKTADLEISVKRYGGAAPVMMAAAPVASVVQALPVATAPVAAAPPVAAPPVSNLITIKSPMIGTFYAKRKQSDPKPIVEVGSEIKPGQSICIIEAMKLFNDIEAEISGRIVEVLVADATAVEFDQPLFRVEPL